GEVVALRGLGDGLAAGLVVGALAVAAHAARMRAPADARLRDWSAADARAHGFHVASGLLMRFLIGLGDVHVAHQEDARDPTIMVALAPRLAIEVELAGYDFVGVEILGHVEVVTGGELD